jgi:hypothetical protein
MAKAATAAAPKLARLIHLIHTMLTGGEEYTDQGPHCCEARNREGALQQLSQRTAKLGLRRVALEYRY